jgi:hypothetical protein
MMPSNILHLLATVLAVSTVWAGNTTTESNSADNPVHSMGFIGCSMAENVAQGYVAVKGQRM